METLTVRRLLPSLLRNRVKHIGIDAEVLAAGVIAKLNGLPLDAFIGLPNNPKELNRHRGTIYPPSTWPSWLAFRCVLSLLKKADQTAS